MAVMRFDRSTNPAATSFCFIAASMIVFTCGIISACAINCNNANSAQLDIDWGNSGTTAPFKALTAADLDLDVTNANIGDKHEIQTNPQTINIKSLSTDVLITAAGSGMTLFAIAGQHDRATDNFSSFADFEAALAADLNGTTSALRLTADGVYDAASNTFTAQRITILLSN